MIGSRMKRQLLVSSMEVGRRGHSARRRMVAPFLEAVSRTNF